MGQRRCCVTDCKSSSQLPECSEMRFHAIPTNDVVRNMWLANCHIEQNRSITKSNVVCSGHFLETDYQAPKNGRRLLNPNAVPTIFAWGNEKSFADHMLDVQSSPTLDVSARTVDETAIKTPGDGTPTAKPAKKMISRSQAAEKQRSASAEDQVPNESNTKVNKARKSLDSVSNVEKSAGKEILPKSPGKKFDMAAQLLPGAKVEVQDLGGNWHNANVAEVDQGEQEVLITFEKNAKAKATSTAFKLNDEWIAMDSSRLRVPVPIQFKEGERCLARWTDSRKFPATVIRPLENNRYEVLFDDGLIKSVKAAHMSKDKRANDKASDSPGTSFATAALFANITPIMRKPIRINPIPKFDLNKFNLPEIPDGEWCCPWINDTPIGDEGFLLNADGSQRPTVLVQDNRLPTGWTKHLYQRSSTSGKWDVVLVGPNNKRFRSKTDVKTYLDEVGQPYNADIYDFSIHKRRAKDIGVYVYTDDYVPPVIPKPATDFKLDSSLDASFQDFKQEPFPGFSPNESTSSLLSKIAQEIKAETSTPMGFEGSPSLVAGVGFTYVGALKVQLVDNLFQCPKEGCNKSFRKENHLQIHVKHYHRELSQQLGACPNMTELAYFRTKGTTIDDPSPKNQIPNAQYFEKSFQSEIRSVRQSISPTRVKVEFKTEDQTPKLPSEEYSVEGLKRKLSNNSATPEVKEKRKSSATDKVASPDPTSKLRTINEVGMEGMTSELAPVKREVNADAKPVSQKTGIPRFKIGHAAKLKTNKVSRRKGKTFKKKFKLGKGFKRRTFEVVTSRPPLPHEAVGLTDAVNGAPKYSQYANQPRLNRLKFLQYSSTDSNSESSMLDQRSKTHFINEHGEMIKIVRMRQEEIINCLCSYGEEDGLMIQCELCLCWQHGGCNGIEKESEVPEKYVCYICRNPERARESMKYIHDQEWLYEGKLYHANYHQASRQSPLRSDILKQSHTLAGNLLELKRSLHSLNVKINIAANKDHPKMYLWSQKWEQSPPRRTEPIEAVAKAEPKVQARPMPTNTMQGTNPMPVTAEMPMTITSEPTQEVKSEEVPPNAESPKEIVEDKSTENGTKPEIETKIDTDNKTTSSTEAVQQQDDKTIVEQAVKGAIESAVKENIVHQPTPVKLNASPKKTAKVTPNIPEPEAAIDSVECQHRLLEHIQKEQNTILSRMQNIDAQILALESMDDHPDTNSTADFAKTSQVIRMLLNDLAKMQKLASINEQSMLYNQVDFINLM